MDRHEHRTNSGNIVYWVNEIRPDRPNLVFLPGLTATHRLFEKQLEYFESRCSCLVWDAPGHGESAPFILNFDMEDKARWLYEILQQEKIRDPILVGQSMGGYVAQMFMELYPGVCRGFVSIDSCSLKRKYVTAFDIWALRRTETMYRLFPWELLKRVGSRNCAETEYGRRLMREMMDEWDKDSYCKVAGHGFKLLADALKKDLEYRIDCPVVLICGTRDRAGAARRYNRRWQEEEGLPFVWLEGAGHNSNTDDPEEVNRRIGSVIRQAAAEAAADRDKK